MTDNMVVIIPARYGSTRLPGKALAAIAGVPMIARVYEAACGIPGADAVYVATDDARIAAAVEAAGGRAVMTRGDHQSGTDRIAEAVEPIDAGIVVNVQGDMPFLDPQMVAVMVQRLRDDAEVPMATVMTPIHDVAQWEDPNVVKVVTDRTGNALYFSRCPIPAGGLAAGAAGGGDAAVAMHHIGLYAYRRSFLSQFARLAPTPLERAERLEQLRALEHGYRIGVATWHGAPVLEVNAPVDLEHARARAREVK
jgi:3-deoxy-manno-octulosonate cytidylyltransferase (CMP-KDO synthetase)